MGGQSEKLISTTYAPGYAYAKSSNSILTNLHTNLKTHIIIKMCRIKFSFISAQIHSPTPMPAHAKYKKPKI